MEPKCASVHRAVRSNAGTRSARGVALSGHEDSQPPVFELRRDPIVGRQILIAEKRATRPNDFLASETANSPGKLPDACPFCAGHEGQTPPPLLEVFDDSDVWKVRVVPNKYPAVALGSEPPSPQQTAALESVAETPLGSHEVIVESPQHAQDITELSQDEFARVLRVYRQRLRDWSADERIEYVSIFKNVGVAAGASLEHVHSQLIALPDTPPVMIAELASAEYYRAKHGTCIFCQLIDEERRHRQRLVLENDSFVALCAYAGRQPYEIWILPRQHSAQFQLLSDNEALNLSSLLQQIVRRLQTQISPLSYNLILHTSPFRQEAAEFYHWHFELVPRSTQLAGFEWGTGIHINPLSPERAAARLVASV